MLGQVNPVIFEGLSTVFQKWVSLHNPPTLMIYGGFDCIFNKTCNMDVYFSHRGIQYFLA